VRSILGPLFNKAAVPFAAYAREPSYRAKGAAPARLQMEAMGANATLFSITTRTSAAVAKVGWHMHDTGEGPGRRAKANDVCDVCECTGVLHVQKHPALSVINKPNSFYTRAELFKSGQQHYDLTGEAWLAVSYLGFIPYELWVMRPDRMVVVTDPDDFLLGYIYVGPDGRERPLKLNEVLSLRQPAPLDPYRGMGAVQTVMSQIEGTSFSAEWNTNFYRNGARPGGIVKLSRRMQDKEFEKLIEKWNYNHRGPANAGRTAFLEEGDWIDVKPMSVAEMQLVETANLSRDTILLAFGASKFDVGVLEDVNRAASMAAKADFAERMTVPRLDDWKGMLNNDLLPLFPGDQQGLEIVYTNPVPSDRTEDRADKLTSAQVYAELIDAGVHPDDAAEVAGLPLMRTVERRPTPAVPV
jgi:HK97 family phage portal protein